MEFSVDPSTKKSVKEDIPFFITLLVSNKGDYRTRGVLCLEGLDDTNVWGEGASLYYQIQLKEDYDFIRNIDKLHKSHNDLLEACKHFFEWHADHFDDFDPDINGELLCLSNEVENAIARAEGRE